MRRATRWLPHGHRRKAIVAGFGVKDNIEEAYTWLSRQYQAGDQLYVFDFSRGAYTARALTGPFEAYRFDDKAVNDARGRYHSNEWVWRLAGGWLDRKVLPTDTLHPSVLQRIEQSAKDAKTGPTSSGDGVRYPWPPPRINAARSSRSEMSSLMHAR